MNEPKIIYQLWSDDIRALIQDAVSEAIAGHVLQMAPEPEVKYLTGEQVDELFHITSVTRYNWRLAGKIKGHKIGRRVLFRLDEIEASMKSEVPLKYQRR